MRHKIILWSSYFLVLAAALGSCRTWQPPRGNTKNLPLRIQLKDILIPRAVYRAGSICALTPAELACTRLSLFQSRPGSDVRYFQWEEYRSDEMDYKGAMSMPGKTASFGLSLRGEKHPGIRISGKTVHRSLSRVDANVYIFIISVSPPNESWSPDTSARWLPTLWENIPAPGNRKKWRPGGKIFRGKTGSLIWLWTLTKLSPLAEGCSETNRDWGY